MTFYSISRLKKNSLRGIIDASSQANKYSCNNS